METSIRHRHARLPYLREQADLRMDRRDLVARSEDELAAGGLFVRLRYQHDPPADPAHRRAPSQAEAIRRPYDPWSVRVTASDLQYDNVGGPSDDRRRGRCGVRRPPPTTS
jgi:hypothetical protein